METAQKRDTLNALMQLIEKAPSFDEACRKTVDYLHDGFEHYDWTGIYMVEGDYLVAVYYRGAPTPHEKIRIGEGVCSLAVKRNGTVIVSDVSKESSYLACSGKTQSEIVVPMIKSGTVIGEIDVDSHSLNAFDTADRDILERTAYCLSRLYQNSENE